MARKEFMDALTRRNRESVVLGTGTSIACLDLMEKCKVSFPMHISILKKWHPWYRLVIPSLGLMSLYRTPKGTITTETVYNAQMRSAGITITHISKYAITSAKDIESVRYIFKNASTPLPSLLFFPQNCSMSRSA